MPRQPSKTPDTNMANEQQESWNSQDTPSADTPKRGRGRSLKSLTTRAVRPIKQTILSNNATALPTKCQRGRPPKDYHGDMIQVGAGDDDDYVVLKKGLVGHANILIAAIIL